MDLFGTAYIVLIVIFSAVIHEVMHAVAAEWLGDHTARYAGRITLNPFPHLDPFGSFIVPVSLALLHLPLFGWAKPVPYNPYNLRPGRFSEAIVSGAGPASNAAIALMFALIIRLHLVSTDIAYYALLPIIGVNIIMATFNMIPVPPLDGSKVLSSLLSGGAARSYDRLRAVLEQNPIMGILLAVLLVNIFGGAFSAVVNALASALSGL